MKTIAQMAGRIKFTENEIAMSRGLSEAAYGLNLYFAKKEKIKLNKNEKQSMREYMFKLISKTVWECKKEFYANKEIQESEFKELSKLILNELFEK